MVFKRKPMQHVLPLLVGGLLAWVAYDSLVVGRAEGRTVLIVYGALVGVWAAFILFHYFRSPDLGELRNDGLTLRRPLGVVSFTWDELQWASMSDERRALVFAYRRPGEMKNRHTGVGRKTIGPEAADAIRAAIAAARPGLPDGPVQNSNADGAA